MSPDAASDSITVVLTDEALEALKEIAREKGIDLEDALREALANERVIAREVARGAKIVIAKADRTMQELAPA
jgi:hypothetical protein